MEEVQSERKEKVYTLNGRCPYLVSPFKDAAVLHRVRRWAWFAAAVRSDCPARPNPPLPFRDAPSEASDESKEDITHPPRRPDRRPVQFGRSWWGYVMGFVRGRVRFYVHHGLPPGYGRTAGGWPGDAQRTHQPTHQSTIHNALRHTVEVRGRRVTVPFTCLPPY